MPVTPADVLHVAALARLRLTPAEIASLTAELNEILGHVAELAQAEAGASSGGGEGAEDGTRGASRDSAGVTEPGSIPGLPAGAADWPAPLRADSDPPDALTLSPGSIAPEWEDGFFTLPRLGAMETP